MFYFSTLIGSRSQVAITAASILGVSTSNLGPETDYTDRISNFLSQYLQ
jgi:hypothetical protein